ncbi:hypothetical protein CerSpe_267760 [Prunus speciosa]
MEVVQRQLGMNGCFSVGRVGMFGGLAILWQDEVTVSLRSYSKGHIDVFIEGVEQIGFRFTGFYGHPKTHLRKHSWELLRRLDGNGSGPSIVGGDFNKILQASEY